MTDPFPPALGSYDATVAHVSGLAGGLGRTLRIARALLEADRLVSLDGLQPAVGLLCARALDLPPDLGRAMAPALADLLADMDALIAALARGRQAA